MAKQYYNISFKAISQSENKSIEFKTASELHFLSIFSIKLLMRAQKEQSGCWVCECLWCCSLIDVTVRVSLLKEPQPYCSSLTHCPLTSILCLSLSHTHTLTLTHSHTHTHTHTHTVQWLQFPSLLSPSVIFFLCRPFISCSLHQSFFIPLPLLLLLPVLQHGCIPAANQLWWWHCVRTAYSADWIPMAFSQSAPCDEIFLNQSSPGKKLFLELSNGSSGFIEWNSGFM